MLNKNLEIELVSGVYADSDDLYITPESLEICELIKGRAFIDFKGIYLSKDDLQKLLDELEKFQKLIDFANQ